MDTSNNNVQEIIVVDDVKKTLEKNNKILEKSIINIELRQQELQNMIAIVQNGISNLENLVAKEEAKTPQQNERIKNLRAAIIKNVSLVREIYDSYDSYEETKFKYRKLISDGDFNYNKLFISIKQIEDKTHKSNSGDLLELLRSISENLNKQSANGSTSVFMDTIQKELDNPDYAI